VISAVLVPAIGYGCSRLPRVRARSGVDVARLGRLYALRPACAGVDQHPGPGAALLRRISCGSGCCSTSPYSYPIYLIGWQQDRAFLLYAGVVTVCVAPHLDGTARIDVRVRSARNQGGAGERGLPSLSNGPSQLRQTVAASPAPVSDRTPVFDRHHRLLRPPAPRRDRRTPGPVSPGCAQVRGPGTGSCG
jgi:hypothetical protein